jgi:hypothetical protein
VGEIVEVEIAREDEEFGQTLAERADLVVDAWTEGGRLESPSRWQRSGVVKAGEVTGQPPTALTGQGPHDVWKGIGFRGGSRRWRSDVRN